MVSYKLYKMILFDTLRRRNFEETKVEEAGRSISKQVRGDGS